MSEDWDYYPLQVDSEPAFIFVNLALARSAPLAEQPLAAYVRLFMRQPRSDGLSSQEEFDDLIAVEDALVEALEQLECTTWVGRNTSGGNRDFYFYINDPDRFAAVVRKAMSTHPEYRYEMGTRPDAEWKTYFDFLYPSPFSRQLLMNRRVVQQLSDRGDTLDRPREINHLAYLPGEGAAESLRKHLADLGFAVEPPRKDGESFAVHFRRMDTPGSMDDIVSPIFRRVEELGGVYDGWGCEVMTADQ